MPRHPFASSVDKAAWRRSLKRWRQASERVENYDDATLMDLEQRAVELGSHLKAVTEHARTRHHRLSATDPSIPDLPPRTDWQWTPELWQSPLPMRGIAGIESGTALGDGVTVHHDCPWHETTARQTIDAGRTALTLDWTGFAGSYLSCVISLPQAARDGLSDSHVIALRGIFTSERGGECFIRLNIRNGPNVAQYSLQQGFGDAPQAAEFDLAYARFNAARVEDIWIDVIFEALPANRISLENITATRHRRAEL